jgi:hypothetical protein
MRAMAATQQAGRRRGSRTRSRVDSPHHPGRRTSPRQPEKPRHPSSKLDERPPALTPTSNLPQEAPGPTSVPKRAGQGKHPHPESNHERQRTGNRACVPWRSGRRRKTSASRRSRDPLPSPVLYRRTGGGEASSAAVETGEPTSGSTRSVVPSLPFTRCFRQQAGMGVGGRTGFASRQAGARALPGERRRAPVRRAVTPLWRTDVPKDRRAQATRGGRRDDPVRLSSGKPQQSPARSRGPTLSPSCRPASWLAIRAPKRHQRAGEPVPGVAATHEALFRVMGTPRPGMSLCTPTASLPASRAPNSLQEGPRAGEPVWGLSCEPPRRAGRRHPSRQAGASCTPSKRAHSTSKLAVRARLRWPPTTVRGDGESHPGSFGLHPSELGKADASRSSMISWSPIGRLASQSSSRTPIWSSFMSSLPVAPFDWRTSRTSPPQNSEPIRRSARVFRR